MRIDLGGVSLKARNYNCFGKPMQGFDRILPMNVIIGRNNSGKSALLDLLRYVTNPQSLQRLGHKGEAPEVIVGAQITEQILGEDPFRTASDGPASAQFGRAHFLGKRIDWVLPVSGAPTLLNLHDAPGGLSAPSAQEAAQIYMRAIMNPFTDLSFKRLAADRDLKWEGHQNQSAIDVKDSGDGATQAIEQHLNRDVFPSELIEETMLDDLNAIFRPDTTFDRILVQRTEAGSNLWEVNLEQRGKGRIPMQHTGSGIKTVLLVLVYLYLIPFHEKKKLSQYLFGFEELENNLHPAVMRRLLAYLRQKAVTEGCKLFITTHSNVAIDLFRDDENTQLIEVRYDGNDSKVLNVFEHFHKSNILSDLGVKASDLLQANAVVWVEGPSDRVYFKRWVELWSGGNLQ
jgi:predicted ATP-dependent endonuclease of OLD family